MHIYTHTHLICLDIYRERSKKPSSVHCKKHLGTSWNGKSSPPGDVAANFGVGLDE
jgi:hypothetical protein